MPTPLYNSIHKHVCIVSFVATDSKYCPLLTHLWLLILNNAHPTLQDEFSLLVEKWNAQRAQAVAHALLKVLYPLMEKELRGKLLREAKEHVLQVRTVWLVSPASPIFLCLASNVSQAYFISGWISLPCAILQPQALIAAKESAWGWLVRVVKWPI